MDDRKKNHKSKAKAVGVKSVLVDGNNIYMTSFGKGNNAVLENKISPDKSEPDKLSDRPAFRVRKITNATIEIEGERFLPEGAVVDKPNHFANIETTVRQDMLCLKDALETRFFGRTFSDNVHIQVIYNILDIEKIIAEYATNAVYALNNLFSSGNTSIDVIGNISTTSPIKEHIAKNKGKENKAEEISLLSDFPKNKRLGYFSNAFFDRNKNTYKTDKHGNIKTGPLTDEEIYQVLELIGSLRQWSFHGNESIDKSGKKKNDKAWLYKLDSTLDDRYKDLLDFIYSEAVAKINDTFEKDNIVNIRILSNIFSKESYESIVREYYGFVVTKKHKNMGFSIKTLREYMLEGTDFSGAPDNEKKTKYDSVRSKLYKLIDFVIYHGYLNEERENAEKLVNSLRSCVEEKAKYKIYEDEAKRLWNMYREKISHNIADNMNGKSIRDLKKSETRNVNLGENVIKEDASYFTELMYLLTAFIDGKEINDLLTTLVHKFDNISSLLDVMNTKELNMETSFVDDYSFFADSKKICEEMVVLNSFARMCPIDVSAKKTMYRDALDILGIESSMTEEELDKKLDKMLCIDENGKMTMDKRKKKSGMRNFIASNVVDSSRFKYLVRYSNPKKIHNLAKCEPAVKFVLKGIPEAQIERYYESCRKPEDEPISDLNEKRNYLAKMIGEMKFKQFKDVNESIQGAKENDKENWEIKVRYQATIRIYLTVMYLMLKNLVNINSRYVMGFHCLERDAGLYDVKLGSNPMNLNKFVMCLEKTDEEANGELKKDCPVERAESAKNRHLRNKKWYKITYENMRNSSKELVKGFRNTVAHVNALRNIDTNIQGLSYANSYFEMYHYIIQKELEKMYVDGKNANKETVISKYIENLNSYHSYSKDFVKAYCVPMAYNVVRYKNLTVADLFDRNNLKSDEKKND